VEVEEMTKGKTKKERRNFGKHCIRLWAFKGGNFKRYSRNKRRRKTKDGMAHGRMSS
jgi:hypothetical protein